MRSLSIDKHKLDALRAMLNDDELLEYVLKQALGAETKEHGLGVALKQAQLPSPLDAALDRLRQALEAARQQQDEDELVAQIDRFTASLEVEAAQTKAAREVDDFYDFVMPGRKKL